MKCFVMFMRAQSMHWTAEHNNADTAFVLNIYRVNGLFFRSLCYVRDAYMKTRAHSRCLSSLTAPLTGNPKAFFWLTGCPLCCPIWSNFKNR